MRDTCTTSLERNSVTLHRSFLIGLFHFLIIASSSVNERRVLTSCSRNTRDSGTKSPSETGGDIIMKVWTAERGDMSDSFSRHSL